MEHAVAGGVDELLKQGLLGLVILALGFFAYRLFSLFVETQEKRIEESKESLKALGNNTDALKSLADLIKDRRTPL